MHSSSVGSGLCHREDHIISLFQGRVEDAHRRGVSLFDWDFACEASAAADLAWY